MARRARCGTLVAMRCCLVLALLVGCGAPAATPGDATSDAAPDQPPPGCIDVAESTTGDFMTSAPFGPAAPGTLTGWDPTGRWFLTGTEMQGVSSFHFGAPSATAIVIDRNAAVPGTISADEIFWRGSEKVIGLDMLVAKRVSNRAADGTLRAQRAVCDGMTCRICTAVMTRATHNANEGEGDHLALVGQLNDPAWGPGYTFNVRFVGTLAYLIRQDGLHIIDTSDPAAPVERGHYKRNGGGYSNDVKLVDAGAKRFALIADFPVDVVDVTNPAAPVLAGTIAEQAHTVAVEARGGKLYAYLGDYDGTCPIYDVTNPAAPQKLGSYQSAGTLVHDLSVVNGIAYLNAWDAGFLVVDYTAPATPTLVGTWAPTPQRTSHSNWTTTAGGRHIALHGEEAYGAHLHLVDVDPASATFMQPFAEWKTRDFVSIHNLMAFGTKAYFTHYQDGVRVLDLADPAHPRQLGYYNTWDPQADDTTSAFFEGAVGLDVDLARKLIYVADSPRGLLILRDDTP